MCVDFKDIKNLKKKALECWGPAQYLGEMKKNP
jgi:hypothetical protein